MDFNDLEALQEKRADVFARMRQIDDAGKTRSLTSAEQKDWDRFNAEFEDLTERIDQRQNARTRAITNGNTDLPHSTPERSIRNGEARILAGNQRFANREQNLPSGMQPSDIRPGAYIRGLMTGKWNDAPAELELFQQHRAQGGAVNTLGGVLLPQLVSDQLIDLARARTVVVQAGAQTLQMDNERVRLAKVTGDPTASWKAENTTVSASTITFGSIEFRARTLITAVKISQELVQDAPNADQQIEGVLSRAMGVQWDYAALLGTGAGEQPLGLRFTSGVTLSTGTPTATTTWTPVINQLKTVYTANYPGNPDGLALVWHPRTNATYMGMVDGQGQPLRQPDQIAAIPRFVTTQVANDTTAYGSTEALPQFLGDFSQIYLGVRSPIALEITPYAGDASGGAFTAYQYWIRAVQRGDVGVGQTGFFSIIVGSTA